jgi:hypothetical protein
MVNRPLEDFRPIGPIFDGLESDEKLSADDLMDESDDDSMSQRDRAIMEQAENWYENISSEETKRKMMVEYINGITDDSVPRTRAIEMVEEAGL